jgi:hypothetical protein
MASHSAAAALLSMKRAPWKHVLHVQVVALAAGVAMAVAVTVLAVVATVAAVAVQAVVATVVVATVPAAVATAGSVAPTAAAVLAAAVLAAAVAVDAAATKPLHNPSTWITSGWYKKASNQSFKTSVKPGFEAFLTSKTGVGPIKACMKSY